MDALAFMMAMDSLCDGVWTRSPTCKRLPQSIWTTRRRLNGPHGFGGLVDQESLFTMFPKTRLVHWRRYKQQLIYLFVRELAHTLSKCPKLSCVKWEWVMAHSKVKWNTFCHILVITMTHCHPTSPSMWWLIFNTTQLCRMIPKMGVREHFGKQHF